MIVQFIEKFKVPLESILMELDQHYLLMLQFSTQKEELNALLSDIALVEDFTNLQSIDSGIRNVPKDQIIKILLEKYPNNYNENILEFMYYRDRQAKNELINGTVILVSRIFLNRTQESLDKLFTTKPQDMDSLFLKYIKNYCFKEKELLNLIGLIILLSDFRNNKNLFDEKIFEDEFLNDEFLNEYFENCVTERIIYQLSVLYSNDLKRYKSEINNFEKRISGTLEAFLKKDKTINDLKSSNSTLKLENKELINKLKAIPKESNPAYINALEVKLRQKEVELSKALNEATQSKKKQPNIYKTLIDNLNEEIITLRTQAKERKRELKEVKAELDLLKGRNILDAITEYIDRNGFSNELYELLKPHYENTSCEKEALKKAVTQDTPVAATPTQKQTNKLGYCIIEDGNHYIVLPGNKKEQIQKISETTYIIDGQFILVDHEFNFKKSFPYRVESPDAEFPVASYGFVVFNGNDAYIDTNNYPTKINNLPYNIRLREEQIISVDSNGNFIRYYKNTRFLANLFFNSAKAKGHEMYFILKCYSNGYSLRHIETGDEVFKTLSLRNNEPVSEHQIIFVKDDCIVSVISSSKFYTQSTFYKNIRYGTVELKGESIFIKNTEGEFLIVKDIPPSVVLYDGMVIAVDEYLNYIRYAESETKLSETSSTQDKPIIKKNIMPTRFKIDLPEIKKSVAIVGNIGLAQSYKLSFLKSGFRTEVIDGYSPYAKIKSSLKDIDIIVIICPHISHLNKDRIREDFKNIPIVFSEYEGANRVLDDVVAYYKDAATDMVV